MVTADHPTSPPADNAVKLNLQIHVSSTQELYQPEGTENMISQTRRHSVSLPQSNVALAQVKIPCWFNDKKKIPQNATHTV